MPIDKASFKKQNSRWTRRSQFSGDMGLLIFAYFSRSFRVVFDSIAANLRMFISGMFKLVNFSKNKNYFVIEIPRITFLVLKLPVNNYFEIRDSFGHVFCTLDCFIDIRSQPCCWNWLKTLLRDSLMKTMWSLFTKSSKWPQQRFRDLRWRSTWEVLQAPNWSNKS